MRVVHQNKERFANELVRLWPETGHLAHDCPWPLDRQVATYLAKRRHGGSVDSTELAIKNASQTVALASIAPSSFDRQMLGVEVAHITTAEALSPAAGEYLLKACADQAAQSLGSEVVFFRLHPASFCLAPMLGLGAEVFGGSVLFAGQPALTDMPRGVAVAQPEDIEQACELLRRSFLDTHLSRDPKLPRPAVFDVYSQWLKNELERGAQVVVVRRNDQCVAVAVCRSNDVAERILNKKLWHLHLLAVHPHHRRQGLGLLVARGAWALALAHGADFLQTGADLAHPGAQTVYIDLGLRPASASFALHLWLDRPDR